MKRTTKLPASQKGFTLIELLLAMAFFGSVLVIATLLLTQTLNIYNKGMTVKQMNQVGRTLIEDMIRVSNSGRVVTTDVNAGGDVDCVSIDRTIYLWNIADTSATNTEGGYKTPSYRYSDNNQPINFVKLSEQGGNCQTIGATIVRNSASEVVGQTVRVYRMQVTSPRTNLIRVSMTLGTFDIVGSDYNLIDNAGNLECKPGGVGNFCAKANFDTVLYAPNGGQN